METQKGERFCDIRIDQALEVGAEVSGNCLPVLHYYARGQQDNHGS